MIQYITDFSQFSWKTHSSTKWVSLLLPFRRRFERLLESLTVLLACTENPERIEIILGLDADDTSSINRLNELPEQWDITALIRSERGYQSLFDYMNTMAQAASGELLFFYTDDAIMKTKHWDTYLEGYLGKPCVLHANTHERFNLLPIVSRSLFQMMGHISLHLCADTWIEDVAVSIGIEYLLPEVTVLVQACLSEGPVAKKSLQDDIDAYFSETMLKARLDDVHQIITHTTARLTQDPHLTPTDPYLNMWQTYYGINSSYITCSRPKIVESLRTATLLERIREADQDPVKQALVTQNLFYACLLERYLEHGAFPPVYLPQIEQRIDLLQQYLLQKPTYFWLWYQLGWLYYGVIEDTKQALAAWQQAWHLLNTQTAWHPFGLFSQVTPFAAPWLVHAWDTLDWEYPPHEREPQQIQLVRGQIQWLLIALGVEIDLLEEEISHHPTALWQLIKHGLETGQKGQAYALIQAMQEHYPFLVNTWPDLPLLWLTWGEWKPVTGLVQNQSWRSEEDRQALLNLQALLKGILQGEEPLALLQEQGSSPATDLLLQQLIPAAWKTLWPMGSLLLEPLPFYLNLFPAEQFRWGLQDYLPPEVQSLRLEWDSSCSLPWEWQRVYDQPTDWEKRIIGPDRLPFYFPLQAQPVEIEGLGEQTLLVMTSDWENLVVLSTLTDWLPELERLQGSVLIWNPLQGPTEQQMDTLAVGLPDTDVPMTLISDVLEFEEQAYLLQQVKGTLLNPRGWLNYYYWWSWFQGTPAWGITSAYNPYDFELKTNNRDASDPQNETPEGSFSPAHFGLAPEQPLPELVQKLHTFYAEEAETRKYNLFWKLKIAYLRKVLTKKNEDSHV